MLLEKYHARCSCKPGKAIPYLNGESQMIPREMVAPTSQPFDIVFLLLAAVAEIVVKDGDNLTRLVWPLLGSSGLSWALWGSSGLPWALLASLGSSGLSWGSPGLP